MEAFDVDRNWPSVTSFCVHIVKKNLLVPFDFYTGSIGLHKGV
jgi:hypothetical protein